MVENTQHSNQVFHVVTWFIKIIKILIEYTFSLKSSHRNSVSGLVTVMHLNILLDEGSQGYTYCPSMVPRKKTHSVMSNTFGVLLRLHEIGYQIRIAQSENW